MLLLWKKGDPCIPISGFLPFARNHTQRFQTLHIPIHAVIHVPPSVSTGSDVYNDGDLIPFTVDPREV